MFWKMRIFRKNGLNEIWICKYVELRRKGDLFLIFFFLFYNIKYSRICFWVG